MPFSVITLCRATLIIRVLKPKGDHLKRLMERAWFFRSWTFQEGILPDRLVLVFGTMQLYWDVFLRGMLVLSDNGEELEDAKEIRLRRLWLWLFKVKTSWADHLRPAHMPWSIQISRAVFHLRTTMRRKVSDDNTEDLFSYDDFQTPYNKISDHIIPGTSKWRFFAGFLAAALQTGIVCEIGNAYGDIQKPDIPGIIAIALRLSTTWGVICAWILPKKRAPHSIFSPLKDSSDDRVVETTVHFLRERQATDPRNLAYALHGILTQLHIPELSSPDLSKDQGQVYHDLFSDLLRWKPAFIILLLDAGGDRSRSPFMSNAPTWVPNWAELPFKSRISRKLFLDTDRESLGVNTTPGLAPVARSRRRDKFLIVRGILLCDVAFSTQGFRETNEDELTVGTLHPESDSFKSIAQFVSWIHWRAFEKRINQLPNYEATVSVDGFDPFQVHFVHKKSSAPDAIPLLFLHGWPGHFYEVSKILPLLKGDFHVVAPSLPNSGFSSRIDKPGFGMKQYAETCHKLMQGLGYETYAGQGGDWQKQRPVTVGVALEDSPVALLAWVHEKLVAWTDDEVCEWISLHWFSRAGPAASVVIYHEAFRGELVSSASLYTHGAIVGFSYFPKELFRTPSQWNKQIGDVVFEREHEHGGHFAAWEQPEAFASDLLEMFSQGGKARGAFKK
ncbi:hypothetical protein Hte_007920 [Hypoxylon texense]